jgi:hypothetical protein
VAVTLFTQSIPRPARRSSGRRGAIISSSFGPFVCILLVSSVALGAEQRDARPSIPQLKKLSVE